jgi:hypothetical protein
MLSTYHVFFALGGKIGREQPSTPCARVFGKHSVVEQVPFKYLVEYFRDRD